jgi:signal transduction histidine kinase
MRLFTSIFFLLFAYTIAALVFWGISLKKQNRQIFNQQVIILKTTVDSLKDPAEFNNKYAELKETYETRINQYMGEGGTFLMVIMIGASVVYSSFRRRLQLSRQQNNFILAVTHELKSPIAAMKLSLQTMQKHLLDDARRNELVERCIKESDRLNDLCSNMLIASQLEGHRYVRSNETINFSELVEDCVRDHARRFSRMFEEDIALNCKLNGDRLLLQMAVNNLLSNAIKYAPATKPIIVILAVKNECAILQVIDNGPGVPNDEKKNVFNKFYRMGNEDSRTTKGTGLGLYLTAKVIYQHKGRIGIKDNPEGGAIFEIQLPISRN